MRISEHVGEWEVVGRDRAKGKRVDDGVIRIGTSHDIVEGGRV